MAKKRGGKKGKTLPAAHKSSILTPETFNAQLMHLETSSKEFDIQKSLLLKQAFQTDDPTIILKASQYMEQIEKRGDHKPKSLILDNTFFTGQGFKEKSYAVSYGLLRNMARTPIMKAIIETRVEQVADFMMPQEDKYSTGFVIRPKQKMHFSDQEQKITKEQMKRCNEITEWLMNCGANNNEWHGDDIDSFTRKVIRDSLTFDQMCWEDIETRGGDLAEIIAVDGATFRLSDQINSDDFEKLTSVNKLVGGDKKLIKGYPPYYVQLHQGRIIAEFYPWELCFGIRNPQTSILSNGYGRSELEDLINTVTSLLNVDAYNANYFKVGSNPKGIIRVSGNISSERLNEFKSQWQTQMAGVQNAHKLPVIEAEKMDFISTQGTNKEMEYYKYQEFLIKTGCAVFKMDPSEIGFPMEGAADSSPMFSGNNNERLQYSKDKGLKPLVRFYEKKLQKYVIDRLDDEYEIKFMGLNSQSAEQELDAEIKKVQNFKTMNEVREEYGLPPLPNGDIVLNPVAMQQAQMDAMNQQQDQSTDWADDFNPFEGNDTEKAEKSNPITKALEDYIKTELGK